MPVCYVAIGRLLTQHFYATALTSSQSVCFIFILPSLFIMKNLKKEGKFLGDRPGTQHYAAPFSQLLNFTKACMKLA